VLKKFVIDMLATKNRIELPIFSNIQDRQEKIPDYFLSVRLLKQYCRLLTICNSESGISIILCIVFICLEI